MKILKGCNPLSLNGNAIAALACSSHVLVDASHTQAMQNGRMTALTDAQLSAAITPLPTRQVTLCAQGAFPLRNAPWAHV